MGIFQRFVNVVRSNITHLIGQAEDPEKILEQAVYDMQENLTRLRQAVAQAIATQKRTERQFRSAESNADEWYQRAQLALNKGDENLAREALTRRKTYQETATTLKAQLNEQEGAVRKLKEDLRTLEAKLFEAKTKKDMYVARLRSAQASQQLNEMLGEVNSGSAIAAFDRMREKVDELEARSEAAALAGRDPIEQQFKELEAGNSIEDELAALKANRPVGQTENPSLPAPGKAADPDVEAALEELRALEAAKESQDTN